MDPELATAIMRDIPAKKLVWFSRNDPDVYAFLTLFPLAPPLETKTEDEVQWLETYIYQLFTLSDTVVMSSKVYKPIVRGVLDTTISDSDLTSFFNQHSLNLTPKMVRHMSKLRLNEAFRYGSIGVPFTESTFRKYGLNTVAGMVRLRELELVETNPAQLDTLHAVMDDPVKFRKYVKDGFNLPHKETMGTQSVKQWLGEVLSYLEPEEVASFVGVSQAWSQAPRTFLAFRKGRVMKNRAWLRQHGGSDITHVEQLTSADFRWFTKLTVVDITGMVSEVDITAFIKFVHANPDIYDLSIPGQYAPYIGDLPLRTLRIAQIPPEGVKLPLLPTLTRLIISNIDVFDHDMVPNLTSLTVYYGATPEKLLKWKLTYLEWTIIGENPDLSFLDAFELEGLTLVLLEAKSFTLVHPKVKELNMYFAGDFTYTGAPNVKTLRLIPIKDYDEERRLQRYRLFVRSRYQGRPTAHVLGDNTGVRFMTVGVATSYGINPETFPKAEIIYVNPPQIDTFERIFPDALIQARPEIKPKKK